MKFSSVYFIFCYIFGHDWRITKYGNWVCYDNKDTIFFRQTQNFCVTCRTSITSKRWFK